VMSMCKYDNVVYQLVFCNTYWCIADDVMCVIVAILMLTVTIEQEADASVLAM